MRSVPDGEAGGCFGGVRPGPEAGRLDSREGLEGRLRQAGLEPVLFEDHTPALTSLWAGAVLSGRDCGLPDILRSPDWPRGVKPGYSLCISRKTGA